jgi:hypothetical protein
MILFFDPLSDGMKEVLKAVGTVPKNGFPQKRLVPYWKGKKVTAKYDKIRPYVGPILFKK